MAVVERNREDRVKSSTTQPSGTRSIYFRDPDGNLVNFIRPRRVPKLSCGDPATLEDISAEVRDIFRHCVDWLKVHPS